jgi:hypothetical protein
MAAIRSLLIKFIRWLVLGERGGICRSVRGKDNVFQAQGATFNNVELDIIGNKNTIVIALAACSTTFASTCAGMATASNSGQTAASRAAA